MNDKKHDIKEMVEARVQEEASSLPDVHPSENKKLPLSFITDCLFANRIGDANLYAAMHRGKFIYVELWSRWLRWGKHHWIEDIDNRHALAAVERVCEEYQRLVIEKESWDEESNEAKALRRRLNVLRDMPGRVNLLSCASTIDDPLYIHAEKLDKQPYLWACPNGVVDLRTGELSDGTPDQYILNACPVEWKELSEPSPIFMEFLHSCFDGDAEMVDYILRLIGYGLLGVRNDHIWVIFHGPRGRNGKDTLMKIIRKVMGSALAIKISTAMLLQQTFQRSSSQPEPDIMALRGARVAFASEAEAGQRLAMSKLKDLTGGSIITARGINDKHMTSWEQSHLLFFMTNELPKMNADDEAFWTRLHAVHWPIRFVDDPVDPDERPRDPHMLSKLEAELPGILARFVEGCMDYLNNGGLRPPEKVLAYTKEQREKFDDIGKFMNDACIREDLPDNGEWVTRTPVSEFINVCNWWCKVNLGNNYNFTSKRITPTLEHKGIKTKKSSIMYYLGITIKPEVLSDYHAYMEENEKKTHRSKD